MVVSAIDDNGQAVIPLTGPDSGGFSYGFINLPNGGNDGGSNTGPCVEAWAPGQRIKSTWANGSYAYLSGTSMAAPHVAGLAARLLEGNPSMTSVQIEAAVRARLSTIAGSGLAIPQLSPQTMVAQPTLELAESTTRTPASTINFTTFDSEITLRYGATGASYCQVYITRGGLYYAFYYDSPSTNKSLNANVLPRGYYVWSVTCFSPLYPSSANAYTTVNAYGFVKQSVKELNWLSRTTSTGGIWRTLNVPGNRTIENFLVSWSVNDSFAQKYTSTSGDYCNIESYGFVGNLFRDPEQPEYNPINSLNTPDFVPKLLWCTGPGSKPLRPGSTQTLACTGANYPTGLDFGTFYWGNPLNAAPPLGPYEGYKWRLECKTLDDSKAVVMYGRMQ